MLSDREVGIRQSMSQDIGNGGRGEDWLSNGLSGDEDGIASIERDVEGESEERDQIPKNHFKNLYHDLFKFVMTSEGSDGN